MNRIEIGDCREIMRRWIGEGLQVQTVVTSPPYWGLRDYGVDGQLGLEPDYRDYLRNMVEVFGLVRQLLRPDGTLWLNIGDSYAGNRSYQVPDSKHRDVGNRLGMTVSRRRDDAEIPRSDLRVEGLKPKDLMMMPARLALALQDDGWWVRQDIIWCLSGGAWVYARTQKGDMPVMVKDLVRLDPCTVKLWNGEKWTRVLGWGRSTDTSERLELVLRSGERIGCTGGHLWPTQRGNVAARELRVGDVVRTCRIPQPEGCERPAYLTNDALWLCGLYLAEGSRNGRARQLSLSADEQAWLPRIESVAKFYGGTMTSTVDGNGLAVRLYGRVLHSIIDTYVGGAVAIDKHIKVAAWQLPEESLSAMAQGYLDGDGHDDAKNGRWRLGFCRNYALERDLRTLAARIGATLTLKPSTAAYQNGEAPAFRGEWRWERTGHHNEKDRGEIVEIRASRARQFWDIAVEDEPHLFALASGVLTHNCKPNPMPESVRDRFTKAHEYIFLLSRSERYYWDAEAVKEPCSEGTHPRRPSNGVGFGHGTDKEDRGRGRVHLPGNKSHKGTTAYEEGDERHRTKGGLVTYAEKVRKLAEAGSGTKNNTSFDEAMAVMPTHRNPRSVWHIPTQPFKGSHFATFPEALVERCILAATKPGDVVFDPFMGSGTVARVALRLGRRYLGCELNPEYGKLQEDRLRETAGLAL